MTKKRILIVDDEPDLCEILRFNLEAAGFGTIVAHSAESALNELSACQPDVLLLDVMMPGLSGFDLARRVKNDPATAHLPIIFLTARDAETDKLEGFDIGADDYIAKPFSIREVVARVKAVLNRTGQPAVRELSYRGLRLLIDRKQVTIDGEEVSLTKTEYELLHLLLAHQGHVFSRQELLELAWPSDVIVTGRTVDVNITRLRKKLGAYAASIVTRLGYGYYFENKGE